VLCADATELNTLASAHMATIAVKTQRVGRETGRMRIGIGISLLWVGVIGIDGKSGARASLLLTDGRRRAVWRVA
jgi:hypothetical protein